MDGSAWPRRVATTWTGTQARRSVVAPMWRRSCSRAGGNALDGFTLLCRRCGAPTRVRSGGGSLRRAGRLPAVGAARRRPVPHRRQSPRRRRRTGWLPSAGLRSGRVMASPCFMPPAEVSGSGVCPGRAHGWGWSRVGVEAGSSPSPTSQDKPSRPGPAGSGRRRGWPGGGNCVGEVMASGVGRLAFARPWDRTRARRAAAPGRLRPTQAGPGLLRWPGHPSDRDGQVNSGHRGW